MFTARNQLFSFLGFGFELLFLNKLMCEGKKKYSIFIILLSIYMVNFHDTLYPIYLVMMLPYLAEIIIQKIFKFKDSYKVELSNLKNAKYLIITILVCLLTGLLTPTFGSAYTNMYKGMSGVTADFIEECQSVNILENMPLLLLFGLSFGILCFTKTKVKLKDLLFVIGFTILGILTYRSIYFMFLFGIVYVANIFTAFLKTYLGEDINEKIDKFILNKKVLLVFISIFIVLYSLVKILDSLTINYVDDLTYPVEATDWILNNLENIEDAKIWTHFNFGSYLELYGIPVFLDSRSLDVSAEFNDTTVLSDWLNVVEGTESYSEVFDKYEITHALVYNVELINQYIYDDDNYELIYQDDVFSLYERKDEV
jgi:hypothetical protein